MPSLNLYKLIIRPLLFQFDAESVHHFVTRFAAWIWKFRTGRKITALIYSQGKSSYKPVNLAGIELRNAVGLAAGFDKDATLFGGIENLGFGFAEIGTVTPRPQQGNPRPRLERIAEKEAILNRMGFNNQGMDVVYQNLVQARALTSLPLGVNIGKNKDTPNDQAVDDYELLLKKFRPLAQYFTVNISSPNTKGLRDLQSCEFLRQLGKRVASLALTQPVFVKLSPTINDEDLKSASELCGSGLPYAGLILTNTIPTDLGGISGRPLANQALQILIKARQYLRAEAPIISVGGIFSAQDVRDRLDAGATAVQVYTSLIYEGPGLVRRILK